MFPVVPTWTQRLLFVPVTMLAIPLLLRLSPITVILHMTLLLPLAMYRRRSVKLHLVAVESQLRLGTLLRKPRTAVGIQQALRLFPFMLYLTRNPMLGPHRPIILRH